MLKDLKWLKCKVEGKIIEVPYKTTNGRGWKAYGPDSLTLAVLNQLNWELIENEVK